LDPPELESLSPAKLNRLLSILEEVDFLRHFKS
jgi:ABC-type multidrug transport system fused ATPase/permease subunit